ncbi:hypothetical protein ISCGN_005112 [Ixodes scapularis]
MSTVYLRSPKEKEKNPYAVPRAAALRKTKLRHKAPAEQTTREFRWRQAVAPTKLSRLYARGREAHIHKPPLLFIDVSAGWSNQSAAFLGCLGLGLAAGRRSPLAT